MIHIAKTNFASAALATLLSTSLSHHAAADWPYWLLEVNCIESRDWLYIRNVEHSNLGKPAKDSDNRYIDLDLTATTHPQGKTFHFTCNLSQPLEVEVLVYKENEADIPAQRRTRFAGEEKTGCFWNFNAQVTIRTDRTNLVNNLPLFQPMSCRGSDISSEAERVDLLDIIMSEPWVTVGTSVLPEGSHRSAGFGYNGRRIPKRTISRPINSDFEAVSRSDVWSE